MADEKHREAQGGVLHCSSQVPGVYGQTLRGNDRGQGRKSESIGQSHDHHAGGQTSALNGYLGNLQGLRVLADFVEVVTHEDHATGAQNRAPGGEDPTLRVHDEVAAAQGAPELDRADEGDHMVRG